MPALPVEDMTLEERNLLFLTTPALWPNWPYLPLVRRRAGREEECGLLVDVLEAFNVPGYGATVFLSLLVMLPDEFAEMLKVPRETYDTAEEIFAAGWLVD